MEIYEQIELNDCPVCGGSALLEEESGHGYYVVCLDCGTHSVNIDFKDEADRLIAAKKTANLWNEGRVISSNVGD